MTTQPISNHNKTKTKSKVIVHHNFKNVFQTRETFETTRRRAEWFYCLRAFENLIKSEARVFEITCPTKKVSLNYHLNKFSQFRYYIWDVKYDPTTELLRYDFFWIFIDVTLLTSCLSVLSEHIASQSKWQSADLDLLKLAKKGKCVATAIPR